MAVLEEGHLPPLKHGCLWGVICFWGDWLGSLGDEVGLNVVLINHKDSLFLAAIYSSISLTA